MTSRSNSPIQIILTVYPDQPAVLEGLEVWLRLGLISEAQVKRLCQQHLVCTLPTIALAATSQQGQSNDFVEESPRTKVTPPKRQSRPAAGVVQSFMAEVSVLWLLFLGVFMVVVSSAVLAATQWRNFPPVGQYGILFIYTLIFWGLSAWTAGRPNLRLTPRMLQVATLLIIPVNFWMMDGFQLWGSGLGSMVAAIAALILSAIEINLLRPSLSPSSKPLLVLINSIGLSWLHWGWSLSGFPLIATYIGTIGTAFVLYQSQEGQERQGGEGRQAGLEENLSLASIAITFATLLLVGRAILGAKIPISNLGLALGICGWLLCWLSRRDPIQVFWGKAGWVLLLAGWVVSVRESPQQAIAVSGLGLWLLADRLQRNKKTADLVALFLVGLQSFWLLWRVIPDGWQQTVVTFGIQLAGTQFMPQVLIGLGVFPDVVLMVFLAASLRRQNELILALQAEGMALILGAFLSVISYFNPLVRSINLLLSFLTLAVVVRNRTEAETALIYLTQITGLATIAAWIYFALPNLTASTWIGMLLGGAIAQWLFSIISSNWQRWRRSSWHLGLGLAAISYWLLFHPDLASPHFWYLGWLIVPGAIALLAYHPNFLEPKVAAGLSIIAVLAIQPFNLESATPRLISLGIGTLIVLLATQKLQELIAAVLTVGFGLCFSSAVVWRLFSEQMTLGWWVTVLAIASLVLWLLYSRLKNGSSRLHQVYTKATDGWAIALTLLTLTFLTGYNIAAYSTPSIVAGEFILAAAILTAALVYRTWKQSNNWGFYGIAFAALLLISSMIVSTNRSLDGLAIATFALGFIAQLAGDWRISLSPSPPLRGNPPVVAPTVATPFSWHVIPLLYAIFGLILSHRSFDADTGLYTLAAALIGIGIGRRNPNFKPITYLSILGVSAAAYELLVYQLLQVKGGNTGDGITLLAALAGAIAIFLRLFSRWLFPYLRLEASELRFIAHLHWMGGSGLILFALANSLSISGERIWLGVIVTLATYALIQGRSNEGWTYAGIVELGIAISYWLHRVLPDTVLLNGSAAIACIFAFAMYIFPWTTWGWSAIPWQTSAMLLPGIIVFVTFPTVTIQSLLVVAAFYAWLAKAEFKVRISYISVLLANWAMIRIFNQNSITEPLWYALVLGASLLYIAQVDPGLQEQSEREKRHLLRSLATGLICFTALYQAEIGIQSFSPLLLGLLTMGLGIIFSLVGIALRVRAFLYIGTLAFIISVLRQVWLLIDDYSLFLWAIGIVFGSALIWIALTFEARRSQAIAFVQYWLTELENWQ